jgi:hypothetical protein
VEGINCGLPNQLVGRVDLLVGPVVRQLQLPELLGSRQRAREALDAALRVVLGFVENLFGLKDGEYSRPSLQNLFGMEKLRKLPHGDIGLITLPLKQLRTLRPGGLQLLHPIRRRRHVGRNLLTELGREEMRILVGLTGVG